MTRVIIIGASILGIVLGALLINSNGKAQNEPSQSPTPETTSAMSATAIFAGGCFWCVESDFEKLDGVGDVVSGYTGGSVDNPSYKQVSKEQTGHVEAVKVPFDPEIISYRELVDYFFRHVDPLDDGGQFCDRGFSYTTAIFVNSPEQKAAAEAAKAAAEKQLGKPVVTPIRDAETFWIAEDYHQDYYKKNPIRYRYYRTGCGRDNRIKRVWGAK